LLYNTESTRWGRRDCSVAW